MQIIRIEAYIVRAEVTKPYISALERGGTREVRCVVLRMTTDDGLSGLGEADPFPTFTYESPESVMAVIRRYLGPALLGMDPANLAALHLTMDRHVQGNPFAKAAIDVAAHDLLAQALGVPVYQLLGGRLRDRLPLIWPIGGDTPQHNAQEVSAKLDEGYRSFHVKLGALSPAHDLARLQAIRHALGPDIPIMVDVNQGWDRSTTLRILPQLDHFNLSIIEQPVPAWDLHSMAIIQAATPTPISADEALYSTHQALELIKRDAARVFSLKTGKCGGLFRTRHIAAIAEAAGLPCFVNSMIEMGISVAASLHLAASLPNLVDHGHALMSNLRITQDILTADSFHYDAKDILLPLDRPGLGVTLDDDILRQRTIDHFVLEE